MVGKDGTKMRGETGHTINKNPSQGITQYHTESMYNVHRPLHVRSFPAPPVVVAAVLLAVIVVVARFATLTADGRRYRFPRQIRSLQGL